MNTNESGSEAVINSKVKHVCTSGRTKEEIKDFYDSWSDTYESNSNPDRYKGPILAAIECCNVIPEANRAIALVLDVAAGTGLLGKELQQKGFRNIHALDPSTQMLEKAKAKNVYQRYINEFISEEEPLPVDADTYDVVVSSGGMGPGHIPVGELWEMLRITRKGSQVLGTGVGKAYTISPRHKMAIYEVYLSRSPHKMVIFSEGGFIIMSMRDEYLRDPEYDGILEVLKK